MRINQKYADVFLRKVKKMTRTNDWFYIVIQFKDDCRYHFVEGKNNPNKAFKYQNLRMVNRDIKSNLNYLKNNLISYHNKKDEIKHRWVPLTTDAFFDDSDNRKGEVLPYLMSEDLNFIGVVELNPVFSKKSLIDEDLKENVQIGTHVHLFVQNRTHLTPEQVVYDFTNNPKHQSWKSMISSITHPRICDRDFYDTDNFINYHIKQIQGDFSIIY